MGKKRLFDEYGNEVKGRIKKPIYKKWWFWLLILVVVSYALGNEDETELADNSGINTPETVMAEKVVSEESVKDSIVIESESFTESNKETAEEQYQMILDEYTLKIQESASKLVEEYNAEYPNNQEGLEGLAELSNEKISKLAEISNEGIGKMAEVHFSKGSGKYEDYEEWAGKLMDVYMQEGEQITDAYMISAQ